MKSLIPVIVAAIAGFIAGFLTCNLSTPKPVITPAAAAATTDKQVVYKSVEEAKAAALKAEAEAAAGADLYKTAKPLMDNMIEALQKKDFKQFLKDFQPELQNQTSENTFRQQIDALTSAQGKVANPEWVGSYKKGNSTITVWKVKSHKMEGDVVINMSLIVLEGYIKVIGFYLQ